MLYGTDELLELSRAFVCWAWTDKNLPEVMQRLADMRALCPDPVDPEVLIPILWEHRDCVHEVVAGVLLHLLPVETVTVREERDRWAVGVPVGKMMGTTLMDFQRGPTLAAAAARAVIANLKRKAKQDANERSAG